MATLTEALKDKRGFPDAQEVSIGDGLKFTLGELRAFQEATGQDVAKQLEAERSKMAEEQAKLTAAQEEVLKIWTQLEQAKKTAEPVATATANWTEDPFFAPVAKYLKENVEAKVKEQQDQIAQFQKAFGIGVRYIADTFSEMRYAQLPEEFRKEVGYEQAVKTASDKKLLDSGGIPDIRKVYQEWQTPRERKATEERISKEAYEKARHDIMSSQLSRPSGLPVTPSQTTDPNAAHNLRESFQRLKEDPEFSKMVYGLTTGQA